MSEHVRIWHLWALDTLLQSEVSCHTEQTQKGSASPVMSQSVFSSIPFLFPKCHGVCTSKSPAPGSQLAESVPSPTHLSILLTRASSLSFPGPQPLQGVATFPGLHLGLGWDSTDVSQPGLCSELPEESSAGGEASWTHLDYTSLPVLCGDSCWAEETWPQIAQSHRVRRQEAFTRVLSPRKSLKPETSPFTLLSLRFLTVNECSEDFGRSVLFSHVFSQSVFIFSDYFYLT